MKKRDRAVHHHKHHSNNHDNSKTFFHLKWFIIWALIYAVLYIILDFLLTEMLGDYDFFKVKLVYILITGLCFSIFARIIYDMIKKKRVYMGTEVFVFWALTYGLSIWFSQFLLGIIIEKSQIGINYFVSALFIGFVVAAIIKLVKRIEFGIRQPSQILTGVILIFCGILFFRFSDVIFGTIWPEGMAWSWLFGLALLIGGFLMIVAWWRNNVSMFTTKHTVHWKK